MSRMTRFDWFRRQSGPRRRPANSSRHDFCNDRSLRVEALEDRRMLAITVDTLLDELDGSIVDGDISLRDAIAAATAGETIDFSVTGAIDLTLGELVINKNLTITGPGADMLTIDAGDGTDNLPNTADGFRIFNIDNNNNALIDVEISSLTLTGGDASGYGGAILKQENLNLTDITISGNSASSAGGGISSGPGTLVVTGSTISDNSAGRNGGGIFHGTFSSPAPLVIKNSTISGNMAGIIGGGFISYYGTLTVSSSTISGNTASSSAGGFSFFSYSSSTIANSTITGNSAPTGGGMYIHPISAPPTLTNTIVANSPSGGDVFGTLAGSFNLIEDGSGGLGDTIAVDPQLGPLADNGGPTFTHAIPISSPAFNMGDPSFVGPPNFDQRGAGFDRVSGGRVDIGAFELFIETPSLVVNTTSDSVSPLDNLTSLREAILFANSQAGVATITFDPTVFATPQTILLDSQLPTITDAVTITGPGASILTIDAGDGTDNTPNTGDGFRIFNIDDGNNVALIDVDISGLTLTGGDASGNGGAILNQENLSLSESTISSNSANSSGGGIYNGGGTVNVTDSTISGNESRNLGGGIYSGGTLNVTNSTISDNESYNPGGGISSDGTLNVNNSTISGNMNRILSGGGILTVGTATITGSTISGNLGWQGIYSPEGMLTVTGSTISDNLGSGISNGATLTITGSTISGNSRGGILSGNTVTITDSTISGNLGSGGIRNSGTMTISGSTISDNLDSSRGGGIYNNDTLTVANSTISGNSAPVGGGIYAHPVYGTTTVTNSIVANSLSGGDVFGTLAGSFNLIEDGSGGLGDTITGDPLLGPLADNGGPTFTHTILTGSLVINAGDPAFVGPPDFDQRGTGFDRVKNGRIDIGALEREFELPSLIVNVASDTIDVFDDLTSLREAILFANSQGGADTITFDPTVFATPQTILLGSQLPTITEGVTITGPGASILTLDAGDGTDNTPNTADGFRIFNIDDGNNAAEFDVELSGLTLIGGDVTDNGGAISNRENLSLTGSMISENSAYNGGGIYNAGTAIVTGSTVSDNSAVNVGGGIAGVNGTVTIANSTISGNTGAAAGGIFNTGGTVTVTDSTISDNTAASDGGGIWNSGTAYFTNSTISGNTGGGSGGGGIYNRGAVTIANSTISDNAGGLGGGIKNATGGTATVDSSTITGNSATFYGGGIWNNGTGTITNSIVANSLSGGDVFGTLAGSFNLIEDGSGGLGDTIVADPQLGLLTDNGGPTFTHALLVGSPAVNAGDPSFVGPPNFDQRGAGFDRILGFRVDIGAFELEGETLSLVVDLVADTDDYLDNLTSLREAILFANSQAGADTITFDPTVFATPQTILLGSQLPTITDAVTITGLGADRISLDAGGGTNGLIGNGDGFRIFEIDDNNAAEIDVEISGLTLTGGDVNSSGGAIFNRENLSLTDSTISGNSASFAEGGGIYNSGTASIEGSEVSGNTAYSGGGIDNDGTVNVADSTISGNSAGGRGGGIYNYLTATVTNSTISMNTANSGGGIYSDGNNASMTVTNSTISGNSALGLGDGYGGGIYAGGTATITSSTITGNAATYYGGGIFNNGTTTVTNSIVANSTGADIHDQSLLTGAFNLIEDGSDGLGDTITGDPLLGPLADNGGLTLTHALLAGSPAIDMGDPAASPDVGNVPLFDQRGNNFGRVQNGRIDIGAFEVQVEDPSADFDSDGDIDGADFLAWQRGFGTTNAAKTDGDADNDDDVDAADLSVWQSDFGQPVPLAAASRTANSEPSALVTEPTKPMRPANLIDAAMALDWIDPDADPDVDSDEDPLVIDEGFGQSFVPNLSDESIEPANTAISTTGAANTSESTDDADSVDGTWLSEELLEQVFG